MFPRMTTGSPKCEVIYSIEMQTSSVLLECILCGFQKNSSSSIVASYNSNIKKYSEDNRVGSQAC